MVNDTHIDRWIDPRRREEPNSSIDEISSKLCISTLDDHSKPRTSRSGPEIRFINPAIYAESIEGEDEEEVEVRIRVKHKSDEFAFENRSVPMIEASCGDGIHSFNRLADLSVQQFSEAKEIDRLNNSKTYHCSSSTSTTGSTLDPLTLHSKSVRSSVRNVRIEHRCKISDTLNDELCSARQTDQPEVHRYTVNGHRIVKLSASSLSTSVSEYQRLEGPELARRQAYEEWIRKKQHDAQRKKQEEDRTESQKRAEEEKLVREREEKERRDRENFLRWAERKRREVEIRKAVIEKKLELQQRLKMVEDKAAIAKTLYLRQWARKKEEEQKEQQKKQRLKQKRIDEEREKRLQESAKAYEKWREKSKNKPKPATQGLLPHQKAKPAYVNPLPWQSIVNDNPEDLQDENEDRQSRVIHSKNCERKAILSLR